ncbi:MAG TPA: hypothetical protein VFA77_08825, partial [Candidatus Eisenbacteria bacterium]|nr:hypothetical protein [Candidatus Eisenbacteria bacterium]
LMRRWLRARTREASWSAAGSKAPRRFGGEGLPNAETPHALAVVAHANEKRRRRSRSAGALQDLSDLPAASTLAKNL